MQFEDIKNESSREFKDISSEEYRTYIYPGNVGSFEEEGINYMINTIERNVNRPIGLSVSKSGHYVIDERGHTRFFPFGFVELIWKPKENQPNVVI